eukprot:TRINITY_DN6135_c0_g1_i1.p1 TRINITY_DN6135_c0_g1~~TRINITY_DN6135_c0_g1_i1.p1  ORF type:complete len:203 (-),score=16.98 TRINITY_DN6135_c0_g1_i1:191-799(-)
MLVYTVLALVFGLFATSMEWWLCAIFLVALAFLTLTLLTHAYWSLLKYLIQSFEYWWMVLNICCYIALVFVISIEESLPRAVMTCTALLVCQLMMITMDAFHMSTQAQPTTWPTDRRFKCFFLIVLIFNGIRVFIIDLAGNDQFWNVGLCRSYCGELRRSSLSLLLNLTLFYARYLFKTFFSPTHFMFLRIRLGYEIKKSDS